MTSSLPSANLPHMTRLIVIGCTHGYHRHITIPAGDILVHTGDSMSAGSLDDLRGFLKWFEKQPCVHKVLVAGNHCWCFERTPEEAQALVAELAPSVTYLEDKGAIIGGLSFWGSGVTPRFLDWAFNRDRGSDIRRHWDLIPGGLDVLVTHGPATTGMLDFTPHGNVHVGDADLYDALLRTKPKVHLCSHIHHGRGQFTLKHEDGSTTTCYNASICTEAYKPVNLPWVIDLPTLP